MSSIVLKPRLSEKAYALSQALRTYVFEVPQDANKITVAKQVAIQFGVTVTGVKIMNVVGKSKRTYVSRGGKYVRGERSGIRKAYVTIAEGELIPVFAAEEEAAAKEEKLTERLQKAAEKADKKSAKKEKK